MLGGSDRGRGDSVLEGRKRNPLASVLRLVMLVALSVAVFAGGLAVTVLAVTD